MVDVEIKKSDSSLVDDEHILLTKGFIEGEEAIFSADDHKLANLSRFRYWLTINGEDRSNKISWDSLSLNIEDSRKSGMLHFSVKEKEEFSVNDEVALLIGETLETSTRLWGGVIVQKEKTLSGMLRQVNYECQTYHFRLDKDLVVGELRNSTINDVLNFIMTFAPSDFTLQSIGFDQQVGTIKFNYENVSEALDKVAETFGFDWFLTPYKQVVFLEERNISAPFPLTDNEGSFTWNSLILRENIEELKNSIFVRGGEFYTEQSLPENLDHQVDGENNVLKLGYRYRDFTLTFNGVVKNVGIDNIQLFEDGFDALYNFQEKVVKFPEDTPPQEADKPIVFSGQRRIPVSIQEEDSSSIERFGQFQFIIVDRDIRDQNVAIERARAELNKHAREKSDISFRTLRPGLRPGQVISVSSEYRGIEKEDYYITDVRAVASGPEILEYSITGITRRKKDLIDMMNQLLRKAQDRESISEDEVIVFIRRFNEIITLEEEVIVNPWGEDVEPIWVAGPYFPVDSEDRNRMPRATGNASVQS